MILFGAMEVDTRYVLPIRNSDQKIPGGRIQHVSQTSVGYGPLQADAYIFTDLSNNSRS